MFVEGNAEEATGNIKTFSCDLCKFSCNVEEELCRHACKNHAKFSEMEDEESCSDDEAKNINVAEMKSYDVAAKAVDKGDKKRQWYICCNDGCIGEHKGATYNGSLCKTTECECCDDDCKVHLFSTIGSEVVEYDN